MSYRMVLRAQERTLEIPVLPEKLRVQSAGGNKTETVLGLGEVNILRDKKLRTLAWDCFFPKWPGPYVTAAEPWEPMAYIETLQAWRDAKVPVQFVIVGTSLDINVMMGIESLDYDERGGEPGDVYYSIDLKEWRDHTPRRIKLKKKKGVVTAVVYANQRPGGLDVEKHSVLPGETLWSIAQHYLGDGARFEELYALNQKSMDKRNKKSGAAKYTIYTGQVLRLKEG